MPTPKSPPPELPTRQRKCFGDEIQTFVVCMNSENDLDIISLDYTTTWRIIVEFRVVDVRFKRDKRGVFIRFVGSKGQEHDWPHRVSSRTS
jgi:hypothetical protein